MEDSIVVFLYSTFVTFFPKTPLGIYKSSREKMVMSDSEERLPEHGMLER